MKCNTLQLDTCARWTHASAHYNEPSKNVSKETFNSPVLPGIIITINTPGGE